MPFRLSLAGALFMLSALAIPAAADPVEVHYAPVENLERIDVALLRSARSKIDLAAYSLTDWPVIDALIDARQRGVALRIVLDPSQQHAFERLGEITSDIRMKAPGPYMHLKAYSVDGRTLRSGSANLSASGLKQQDNDLVLIRAPSAAHAFEARFEHIWATANPMAAALAISNDRPLGPSSATVGCNIKGNVSRNGERIFHVPGDRNYDRVRTDKGHGERWFCSEEQAIAAGWRKAGAK